LRSARLTLITRFASSFSGAIRTSSVRNAPVRFVECNANAPELNEGITVLCPLTDYSSLKRGGSTAIRARTRHMLRSPLIWYLATLFASLGLLVAIGLDALSGRITDHILPRNVAGSGATGSTGAAVKPRRAETKHPAADASSSSVKKPPALPIDGAQAAAPPAPVSISKPAPATPAAATVPVAPTSAPWPSVTVTNSIAASSSNASAADGRKRANDCLALWDRETHMTKEEWRTACGRIPGQP
jgi:hypothetical protein